VRRDPLGSDEVGVGHAEGLEEAPAEVPVKGHPAHVLDDLAERGEAVIGVREGRTGLDHQPESAAVVLGERGQRLADPLAVGGRPGIEWAPARME
jgi:hypothetical protein